MAALAWIYLEHIQVFSLELWLDPALSPPNTTLQQWSNLSRFSGCFFNPAFLCVQLGHSHIVADGIWLNKFPFISRLESFVASVKILAFSVPGQSCNKIWREKNIWHEKILNTTNCVNPQYHQKKNPFLPFNRCYWLFPWYFTIHPWNTWFTWNLHEVFYIISIFQMQSSWLSGKTDKLGVKSEWKTGFYRTRGPAFCKSVLWGSYSASSHLC